MTSEKCILVLSSNFKKQYKKVSKQGKDLDKWIEYQVAVYPKITTGELAQLSGKSIITIKRRIAKMPHIVYVGSGYSGHWEVRKKE